VAAGTAPRPGSQGRTVLVSSHLLVEVAQTADSLIILDHGRLIAHSPLTDLMAGTQQLVRVRTPRPAELRAALAADGATARVMSADRLEVSGSTPERVGTLAAKLSIPVFEIVTQTTDLEDTFLRLTATAASKDTPT
jgi:ABC-2 type transport system ATP-binding protein